MRSDHNGMGAPVLCRNLAFDVRAEEGRAADQTQTFRCDGAGVRVSFQAKEIAGELYRIKPAVRCCARWQLVALQTKLLWSSLHAIQSHKNWKVERA